MGIWTSTPLLPRVGPSRINAFCTLSTCISVRRRLRWARELFRSSSLARSAIIWVSPRYRRQPLAPFRKSHVSNFWTSISGYLPNLPWQLGILSLESNFSLGISMEVMRLRFTSLLVMFRMHLITWVFPNDLGHTCVSDLCQQALST